MAGVGTPFSTRQSADAASHGASLALPASSAPNCARSTPASACSSLVSRCARDAAAGGDRVRDRGDRGDPARRRWRPCRRCARHDRHSRRSTSASTRPSARSPRRDVDQHDEVARAARIRGGYSGAQALGRNPFMIIVPCHRVLETGHYADRISPNGGSVSKRRLLPIEGGQPTTSKTLFDVLLPVARPRPQA